MPSRQSHAMAAGLRPVVVLGAGQIGQAIAIK